MEDYEIALKKWAYGNFMDLWNVYAARRLSQVDHIRLLHGFNPEIHTWRDINVEEYNYEGYASDDSYAESADHGFRYSVAGDNRPIEHSTAWQMGRTIYEISRIEVTDEDRASVEVKKKRK